MIRSMTGYGAAEEIIGGRDIRVEIKSVNHRYFEFAVRAPRAYGYLEDKLKRLASESISRGKVEAGVSIQNLEGPNEAVTINRELAASYVAALRSVAGELGVRDDISLSTVARFPDVFTVTRTEDDEEEVWRAVKSVADKAVAAFVSMRETEGEKMREDLLSRCDFIIGCVEKVEERSPQTVAEYREKLYARMCEVLQDAKLEEARILTEAAIYADKVAVAEETVRLRSHIDQFRAILELKEPVGRKLDFLVQEINREANTIGSKACDVQLARVVVDLKSEIEKIREQIQNIE